MSDSSSDSSSDSDLNQVLGWALRVNGSCLSSETDCGPTVNPYRVCCPGRSYCPEAYNVACCPSSSNCTEALEARPHCANETWDLYFNGGYFCCEQGTTGYAKEGGSNGCGSPGYELGETETSLVIMLTGSATSSSTSAAPASSSTANTTTSTPEMTATQSSESVNQSSANQSSSTNTGAIAGGVVGGVAGAAIIAALLWFLFRARRQLAQARPMATPPDQYAYSKELPAQVSPARPAEMEGQRAAELEGDHRMVAELPDYYGR